MKTYCKNCGNKNQENVKVLYQAGYALRYIACDKCGQQTLIKK